MIIKVSKASGPVLDWMVAKCWYSDRRVELTEGKTGVRVLRDPTYDGGENSHWFIFFASTNWAQGGPIIEREIDCLRKRSKAEEAELARPNPNFKFKAEIFTDIDGYFCAFGSTPLIAAMRCYVVSELGEEVEVPDELC